MSDRSIRLFQPGARRLLARILEQPDLPAEVQRLAPPVLGKLIEHVGLEDAGEIVALASTEQLAQVFDEDLWKNERPGQEEQFDAGRFLVWLEVMLEAGDSFAAKRLSELPEDLVTLALHKHVLVLTLEALAAEIEAADDGDLTEKALGDCLGEELDEYQLIARQHDGWDNLLTVILALDRDHHPFLQRVLERCAHMAQSHIEDNGGLYEVLTSEEMLAADVAGEREDRRAEMGYVAPQAASSFLKLARVEPDSAAAERDPVTRAYFRGLIKTPPRQAGRGPHSEPDSSPPAALAAVSSSNGGLAGLLREAGIGAPAEAQRLLPAPAGAPAAATQPLLIRAMQRLAAEDPGRFAERTEELAYLTNVLVAGGSFQKRRFRPIEALHAVVATCSLGLELSMAVPRPRLRKERLETALHILKESSADALFRRAWPRLNRLVRRAAAAAKRSPALLKGELQAEDLAALQALTDECPTLAGGLAPPRKDELPTFVATANQLVRARRFLRSIDQRSRAAARPRRAPPR